MSGPTIQHWLVQVTSSAGLGGTSALSIDASEDPATAWATVVSASGVATDDLAELVAAHFGLQVADLEAADETATKLLPARTARRLLVLPLRYTERTVTVASADPHGLEGEREIAALADRAVVFEVAPPGELLAAIEAAYPPDSEDRHRIPELERDETRPAVLVVDDDADMRLLLGTVLEAKGFAVTTASGGPEALERMAGAPFHLVTLDLQMDEMHGLEVLRRIREAEHSAYVPVVVATATGTPEAEIAALAAGADDFMVKPIDPARFLLRVQAVLRRCGAVGSGAPR